MRRSKSAAPRCPQSFLEPLESRALLSTATGPWSAAPAITAETTREPFRPMTSAELQTALEQAQLGDTIILQAGVTYTGTFTLRNKTQGTGWITIQSSNLDALPAEGVRVSPADAVNMPRIQSPGSNAQAIKTAPSAHHYRIVGVEIVGPANNTDLVTLVELGDTTTAQNTVDVVPHHLVIDRCYLRPNTPAANIRRAIGLHSASTDITNSYIEEIHEGSDSNAIAGWNGTGPYNIINNHLEGAGENIMFGGATGRIPGVVPSDIVIRGNHILKPLHWRDGSRGYKPVVKNLFELKCGARVLLEDNILENCWTSGQTGVAIVLKLGDYASTPWNVTEDVTLRNNIIRHANGGVALQGRDYASNSPDGLVRRLSFVNNVFDDINGKWGTSGTGGGTFFLYMTHGPKDVTFDHNTMFNGYTAIEVDSNSATYPVSNFVYTNNIVAHNTYGVRSTLGTGNPTFNAYFTDPGHRFEKNILMGGLAKNYTSRPNNFFPGTWDAVGFEDKAGGDYRLDEASIYNNAGTDGKDVGADIEALTFATRGAITGVWEEPPPPPPEGPSIASLTASAGLANVGTRLTFTANGVTAPGSTIQRVEFYRDTNANGVLDVGTDLRLGGDPSSAGGWTLGWDATGPGNPIGTTTMFFARAQDAASTWGSPVSTTVTINALAKVGTFAVAPTAVTPGNLVTLTASKVTDNDGTVQRVLFYRDANADKKWDANDLPLGEATLVNGKWVMSNVATAGLPLGKTAFFARAEDDRGVLGPDAKIELKLTTPPTVGSLTVAPQTIFIGSTVTLTANDVTDSDGSVAAVEFYRDANGNGVFEPGVDKLLLTDSNASNGWSVRVSSSSWTHGNTVFFARAKDNAGMFGPAAQRSALVNAVPTVGSLSVSPTSAVAGASVRVTAGGVVDKDGAVAAVAFYRDVNGNGVIDVGTDALIATDTSAADGYAVNFNTTGLAAGSYRLLARAQDNLGAWGPARGVTLNVTAPATLAALATTDPLKAFSLEPVDDVAGGDAQASSHFLKYATTFALSMPAQWPPASQSSR